MIITTIHLLKRILPHKSLVSNLADGKSEDKMTQMAVSLVAEYLRNVGYDIANPNSYIKKVLGCNGLEFTDSEEVQNYDVFDIISEQLSLLGNVLLKLITFYG